MRFFACAMFALTTLAVGTNSMAVPTWCSGFSNSIVCDDFDRYCVNPPTAPQACPVGGDRNDPPLRQKWVYNSWNYNTRTKCGSNMCGEENTAILPTDPYGGRHANGGDEGGDLGQNTIDLTPYVQASMPGYTTANGSDEQPLVLTFTMSALAFHAMLFNNGYMELSLGDPSQWSPATDPAKAPTDFVMVGADNGNGCVNCNSTCTGGNNSVAFNAWPTICQQEFPHPLCPPKSTFVARTAIAVGALALLDNNPCHCCTTLPLADPTKPWRIQCVPEERDADLPDGWQEPTNIHLSFFDGLEWRVLREGMGGPGSYGDFRYGNYKLFGINKNTDEGFETVVLTIKTNTMDIYHKTKMVDLVGDQWVETWVESKAYDLPRRYTGAFNRLRAGTDESCMLENDRYVCSKLYVNGLKKCKRMKEELCAGSGSSASNTTYRSSYVSFDNVKLSGGVGGVLAGACCKDDASCTEVLQTQCENIEHGRFQGEATTCVETFCCPYPFADTDADRDMDSDDFAVLQRCLTVGQYQTAPLAQACRCLDHDSNGQINNDDVLSFISCATGPAITTESGIPACMP